MKQFLVIFSLLTINSILSAQVTMQAKLPSTVAAGAELTFDVVVTKVTSIANFAKYQMDVPAGVTISQVDNKGGSFSFDNNRAKIIWVAIPGESDFTLTMKLNSGSVTGPGVINQKFYYLDGGTKKEVEADPITINFGGSAASADNTKPADSQPAEAKPAESTPAVQEVAASGNSIVENAAAPANEATSAPVKETPLPPAEKPREEVKPVKEATTAAAGNITYKIQIGAYGENPGMSRYNALKDVKIINESGFYKVMVGNFKTREDAVKRKEELLSKGFKGFLVPFENGQRMK